MPCCAKGASQGRTIWDSAERQESGREEEEGEMGMLTARKWQRDLKASVFRSGTSGSTTTTVTNLSPLSKTCTPSLVGISLTRESTKSPGLTLRLPKARVTSAVGDK